MARSYSPIDESSFTDSGSFDPAELLGTIHHETAPEPSPTDADPVQARDPEPPTPPVDAPAEPQTPVAEAGADTDTPHAQTRVAAMLADSRSAMFLGLVLVIAAVFTFFVCGSYFMNLKSDQSAVLNGDFDPTMIRNAGGPVGAWLAHTLIYEWLGVGAFILIFYLLACGLKLLKVYRTNFWGLTMRCLLGAIALSVIAGLVTFEASTPVYWGGLHGYVLNTKLIALAGVLGAVCVSVILAGMIIFLYYTELKSLFATLKHSYSVYSQRQAARRAEKEEIAAQKAAARRAAEEAEAAEAAARAEREAQAAKEAEHVDEKPQPQPDEPVGDDTPDTPDDDVPDEREKEDSDPVRADFTLDDTFEVVDTEHHADENPDAPLFTVEVTEPTKVEPLFADAAKPEVEIDATGQPLMDPRAELSRYKFPPVDLLREVEYTKVSVDSPEMEENKNRIIKTLQDYGIPITRIKATVGPTVTLYEIIPAEGVRIAKIKRLEDDIALSLAALGIRIIAPIPGKGTIGIEVPNKNPQTVSMRSVIESEAYQNCHMELPMAMGNTISNEVFIADLCKMPHLLVAGATGMGKSVGLNAIIASLLYKKHPAELKFVLVDPKMVEFSLYSKLERHYLAKLPDEEDAIITDPSKVVATLNSLCVEMDNRYALLKDASMRNIKEYNDRFRRHGLLSSKGHRYLPYIVVIVDEFADLIMTAGKEVETPIARIAQKARAVGIHMILATQRPSTNVITGVIKANFPGRIAFRVFQMVDSRTIIDRPGANQLIGRGDMLFSNNGKIDRVQCAFIDTPEVKAICDAIDGQIGYDHAYELPEYIPEGDGGAAGAVLGDRDPLFDECARLVVSSDTASTSSLQRRYSIGYNRAGKIMDQMEAAGIVGPSQGGKPRQVLVDPVTLERILENN